MKLPFTEKFLWDLYNLINSNKPIKQRPIPTSWSELVYPEYIQIVREYKRKQDRERFRKLIHYLKKKGWIEIKNLKEKDAILITSAGRTKLFKIARKIKPSMLPKRKDGKWCLLMYDIPYKNNKKRFNFLYNLKELGYRMLQKSVWISPYDVLKETKELINKIDFEDYVRLLLVQEIEI